MTWSWVMVTFHTDAKMKIDMTKTHHKVNRMLAQQQLPQARFTHAFQQLILLGQHTHTDHTQTRP